MCRPNESYFGVECLCLMSDHSHVKDKTFDDIEILLAKSFVFAMVALLLLACSGLDVSLGGRCTAARL